MSHAPVNATELSCAEYTEELTQFRMGLLDEADAEVAQQHLYACPDCRLFTHQVETGRRTPRLGRRRPARADTEVVDVLGHRGLDLRDVVGGVPGV